MKSAVLLFVLAQVLFLNLLEVSAQRRMPFEKKWPMSQAKADRIAAAFSKEHPDITHHKVVYKSFFDSIANRKAPLDMFIAVPQGKGPFPVIIFVHGGGFVGGDKSAFTPQSFAIAQKGVAAVSIEYRLKGHGGTFSDMIGDVMDAIDFVRNHAKEYHIDFSRLALAGGSAGGYLSSYAAMKSPECICYVGYNGLYDVEARAKDRSRFLGNGIYAADVSPILMIKTPPPATLLIHGKEDTTLDFQLSVAFAEAIRAKGGDADLLLYEGQKHGFFNREPYLTITTQATVDFVVAILNP